MKFSFQRGIVLFQLLEGFPHFLDVLVEVGWDVEVSVLGEVGRGLRRVEVVRTLLAWHELL